MQLHQSRSHALFSAICVLYARLRYLSSLLAILCSSFSSLIGALFSLFPLRPFFFFFLMIRGPPRSPLFPYTPLFRSPPSRAAAHLPQVPRNSLGVLGPYVHNELLDGSDGFGGFALDLAHLVGREDVIFAATSDRAHRSEEHTSELQSHLNLVCRLLLA